MSFLNGLFALFGLFMLAKHGRRALLFVVPKPGQARGPFFVHFVNALLALLLLAGAIRILQLS